MSTTSTLDGWKVLEYKGPVSCQIVVGTGLLTDVFSSFTDFFGAHSRSYQQKLDQINQEALKQLRDRALRLNANAVLGARIDHDEVSGAGKSMLMVTAMGTAVVAEKLASDPAAPQDAGLGGTPSARDVNTMERRHRIRAKTRSGSYQIADSEWPFLIEHQVEEAAPSIIAMLDQVLQSSDYQPPTLFENARLYFGALTRADAVKHLYDTLASTGRAWRWAAKTIVDLELFDSTRITELLRSENPDVRAVAISVATAHMPWYEPDDLAPLRELLALVEAVYPPDIQLVKKKKALSSSTKEVWECECGKANDAATPFCRNCGRDSYGFRKDEIRPVDVVARLKGRIAALEELFSQQTG